MKKYITFKNLGWFLLSLVSAMLLMSGVSKIIGTQEMVNNFTYINLLSYLPYVGIGEVLGVGLLLYPRTSIYGAILLSCIMSAAIAVHLSYMGGSKVMTPINIIFVIWVGHCLRKYVK
jgi:uncharacterized membrane protein YphA (DoxX/SURF4 family)